MFKFYFRTWCFSLFNFKTQSNIERNSETFLDILILFRSSCSHYLISPGISRLHALNLLLNIMYHSWVIRRNSGFVICEHNHVFLLIQYIVSNSGRKIPIQNYLLFKCLPQRCKRERELLCTKEVNLLSQLPVCDCTTSKLWRSLPLASLLVLLGFLWSLYGERISIQILRYFLLFTLPPGSGEDVVQSCYL